MTADEQNNRVIINVMVEQARKAKSNGSIFRTGGYADGDPDPRFERNARRTYMVRGGTGNLNINTLLQLIEEGS